jgi:hypothetical protein
MAVGLRLHVGRSGTIASKEEIAHYNGTIERMAIDERK